MTSRIPNLLEAYLSLPPECSQILLTSVLGASTNWLLLRYLYSLLKKSPTTASADESSEGSALETNVVLVSFLRDYTFWKEGAGKFGLDLDGLARSGRFVFVDGLTGLFFPDSGGTAGKGRRVLRSARVQDVQKEVNAAIADVRSSTAKTVLVIDQLDFLLAATEEDTTGLMIRSMLLDLQEGVHASILTASADEPLVSPQTTTLEKEHAAFILSLAHGAEAVLSLRLLDTGAASDVSGVVRITRGGDDSGRSVEEHEYLYFVGGDGSVKVFERGQ